eukprot:NODE_5216_length_593_cov_59.020221_g4513_i0.p1 GENE.NODE_5216_length_593_cov_59.020221_g4513_i0~~NODE_5216_length_593_cov_59.020221_g4513_i0.p1  ORF type:complete len:168 (-),score=52.29 NODE_5216_length_593_cov_59.020221_g4513_i0:90-572(-)
MGATFGMGNIDNNRFLAVNSYDNVLRVYDRGSFINTNKLAYRVRHQLYGIGNKNHTIRSAFHCGKKYSPQSKAQDNKDSSGTVKGLNESILLATGSSDGFAYVYDISDAEGKEQLLQKLGAHRDVVYGVTFHPDKAVMASFSKDSTIKVWAPRLSPARES